MGSLAPEWDALLERSSSNSLFLTHRWVSTWWTIFGHDHRLLVLIAREGKALVGVAPFMVAPGRNLLARAVRHLVFLGQNQEVYPEYLDVFVERGREPAICGALAEFLLQHHRHKFDVVHLKHVLADSPCAPVWRAAFARAGIDLTPTNRTPCPTAELPSSVETYMAGRSSQFRRRVAYYERRLGKEGAIAYLFAPRDIAAERCIEEVVRLNESRWGDSVQSFRTRASLEFHRRIAPVLVENGQALLMLMTLGNRVVAGRYDFVYGGKVWSYQGGWLRDYEKRNLGTIILAHAIQWAIEHRLNEYDFLGGAAQYKDEWSTATRWMSDYQGYRNTLAGRASQLATRGKAELKNRISPEGLRRLKALREKLGL